METKMYVFNYDGTFLGEMPEKKVCFFLGINVQKLTKIKDTGKAVKGCIISSINKINVRNYAKMQEDFILEEF